MFYYTPNLSVITGAVCLLIALGWGVYHLVQRFTGASVASRGRGSVPGPRLLPGPLTLFDRVMQIRGLFAGLPPEHHGKLLKRLYQDLLEQRLLDTAAYERLVQTLDQTRLSDASEASEASKASAPLAVPPPPASGTQSLSPPGAAMVVAEQTTPVAATLPATTAAVSAANSAVSPTAAPPHLLPTTVPLADASAAAVDADLSPHVPSTGATFTAVVRGPSTPAPWDMPDPPPRVPRKSLAEWSQSFMEAKNIHWGELASGILIVGSALGLVLSLRRELQDTIPYFPALLFLLISLAVHQAGVYTLQRWRLRSTSRGLLLISLLLVPLNFLAGILFNAEAESQRSLGDPWLWTAIGIGTAGLGWITWSAAGCLLQRGRCQLLVPLLTIGLGLILLNRWPWAHENDGRPWAFLPLVLSVALPWAALLWSLAARPRASAHSATRVWIVVGISLFSLGTAYAAFLLRAPRDPLVLSSLAPASALWLTTAIGLLAVLNCRLPRDQHRVLTWVNFVLSSVFWFALAVLLLWSWRCPRDLLLLTAFYTVAASAAAIWTRQYPYVPLAAGNFLLTALMGRGLWSGVVSWHGPMAPEVLLELVLNGRAAVLFLLTAGGLIVATPWIATYFAAVVPDPTATGLDRWWNPTPRRLRRWNFLAAIGLVGVGSTFAILGAYRPTTDVWDSLLGTSLLLSLGLTVVVATLWGHFRWRGTVALTVISTLLLLATGLEAAYGNRYLQTQWSAAGIAVLPRGLAVGTGVTTLLWVASLIQARRARWQPPVTFAATAWLVGLLSLFVGWAVIVREPFTLFATATGFLLTVLTVLSAHVNARGGQTRAEITAGMGLLFLVGTGYQATAESATRLGSAEWAFVSAAALGLGCLAAGWFERICRQLKPTRPFSVVADAAGAAASASTTAATATAAIDYETDSLNDTIKPINSPTTRNASLTPSAGFRPRELALALVPIALVAGVLVGCTDAVNREIWSVAPPRLPTAWQLGTIVNLATAVLLGWAVGLLARALPHSQGAPNPWSVGPGLAATLGASLLIAAAATQGVRWDADTRAASGIRWSVAALGLAGALATFGWPGWFVRRPQRLLVDHSDRLSPPTERDGDLAASSSESESAAGPNRIAREAIVTTWVIGCVAVVFSLTALAVAGFLLVGPGVSGVSPRMTWLGKLRTDATYGLPVAGLLAMVLLFSISQRQRALAIAGSYLLRSIVAFQLLLLVLSPHPRLATEWFVMIVQMVSAGMTLYAWAWWANRERCMTPLTMGRWRQPLQMHAVFNAALLLGLMSLIVAKYWVEPLQPLGWIQAAGNIVGWATILAYLPLYYVLFLRGDRTSWLGPIVMLSMVVATMTVVNLERWGQWPPGQAFLALGWAWVLIAGVLAVAHGLQPDAASAMHADRWTPDRAGLTQAGLWGLVSGLLLLFSVRGLERLPHYEEHFLAMPSCLLGLGLLLGAARQATWLPWLLAPLASAVLIGWIQYLPQPWVSQYWMGNPSVHLAAYQLIAGAWVVGYLLRRYSGWWRNRRAALSFGRWTMFSAMVVIGVDWIQDPGLILAAEGRGLLGLTVGLTLLNLWCDREHWRTSSRAWVSLAVVLTTSTAVAATVLPPFRFQGLVALIAAGGVVFAWGVCLHYAAWLQQIGRWLRVPRLAATRAAANEWLPILAALVGAAMSIFLSAYQILAPSVWERQVSTFAPLLVGLGYLGFATVTQQAWQRYVAIALFTFTALCLSLTTLPFEVRWSWNVLLHTYWVFGCGYLAYGFGAAHVLRTSDAWRETLLKSSLALLLLAIGCLSLILFLELGMWLDNVPQRSAASQSILVALMTGALAVSLIVLAISPAQPGMVLELRGRQALVYAAQLLLVGLMVHSALTLPWLFRFGIQQYWPYLAMVLAFGGIGVWQWLQRRGLIVLSEPLATTLLLFPAAAASVSLGWPAETDRSLVLLLAGLVYGCLAVTHPGFWTRLAALACGNMALWLLWERLPALRFENHPQLWLIPPAVATLILSWIEAPRLGPRATTSLRYLALAAIYISSTSELFIHGIGKSLAPPMILATLAVLGMLLGMLLNIREYIVLGVLFLLVAMFTMVSHAQQQLGHVWPWWAFGITLGAATLVFFGIFEQRRNQKRQALTANQPKNTTDTTVPNDNGQ